MKRIVLAVSVLLILLGGATALAVLPEEPLGTASIADANQVGYWCPSGGIKVEPVSTPFTVPAPPEGKVWTLLVLKAGSDQSADPVNETFPNPAVGQAYSRTDGKSISHAILCYETAPPPPTLPPPPPPPPGSTSTTICVDCVPNTQGATTTTIPASTTTAPGATTTVPAVTTTTQPAATTTTAVVATGPPPVTTNPAPPPAVTIPATL